YEYYNVAGIVRLAGLYFFFFQAEDGIRDFHVTGVQTCALPIYSWLPLTLGEGCTLCVAGSLFKIRSGWSIIIASTCGWYRHPFRSEERRVGKECRSRLAQDQ